MEATTFTVTTGVRESCVLCALKHLAQARALSLEAHKGYPQHFWFALGHMAEAEDELVEGFPQQMELVRTCRKSWESNPGAIPDFGALIIAVSCGTGYDPTILLPVDPVLSHPEDDPVSFWRGLMFALALSAVLWYGIFKAASWFWNTVVW